MELSLIKEILQRSLTESNTNAENFEKDKKKLENELKVTLTAQNQTFNEQNGNPRWSCC